MASSGANHRSPRAVKMRWLSVARPATRDPHRAGEGAAQRRDRVERVERRHQPPVVPAVVAWLAVPVSSKASIIARAVRPGRSVPSFESTTTTRSRSGTTMMRWPLKPSA